MAIPVFSVVIFLPNPIRDPLERYAVACKHPYYSNPADGHPMSPTGPKTALISFPVMPFAVGRGKINHQFSPSFKRCAPRHFFVSMIFHKNLCPLFQHPLLRISSKSLVFNAPGAMAFTSIPKSFTSPARPSMKRMMAAFDAA